MMDDIKEIDEDVRFHAMGPWVYHPEDKRICSHHSRLDIWVCDNDTNQKSVQCTRSHEFHKVKAGFPLS